MGSKTKGNVYSASNINTEVLQELADIAEIGIYGDLTPIILFVKKSNLIKAITNITYFASVNDIGQVARNAKHLAKLLGYINHCIHFPDPDSKNLAVKLSLLEERDHIVEFYHELCNNHLKTIYKFYGLRKPLAVIALTSLLLALVEYKNHSVLSTFHETFDFNHSTLPKILVPTRDEFEKNIINEVSMRYAVMELWIAICANSNSAFRKSLMTNFKIMNNFWKHVDMERYETLLRIIKFVDTYVLCEASFKRSTKCQILNENFLYSFRNLFALVNAENTRKADTDLLEFESFKTNFIDFMNVLVSDQSKGITYPMNEFGSPLVVNNKTFKVNNKLIFTLLTSLKPWDSPDQLQYCLKILTSNLELVAPYMNWIVTSSGGYHDPSLTSYWIGHTLLYSSILKSLALPVQADLISLAPLSKNSLTECLSFPNDLVKQLGLQLILFQLIKVAREPSQLLIESVLGNLPTQASFAPLLDHKNRLVKLTATVIIKRMESLVPSSSSSGTVSIISEKLSSINVDECDSFEFILLDSYLSIQSNNELKWWNKPANGNSFFTSLLKLSNIDFLKPKVYRILEKLTRTSFIFGSENLIESPLLMLIDSIANFIGSESFDKIWNCLDESIARSMKSPYKYLDMSHTKYHDICIFVVVLFEQLSFIPDIKNITTINKWLQVFMTKLIVIGESQKAIECLSNEKGFRLAFDLDSISVKENIISKFDFAEAVVVLNRSLLKQGENRVFEIIGKMGNYLLGALPSDERLFASITNPDCFSCFKRIALECMSANDALALSLFSELFQNFHQDFSGTDLNSFLFIQCKDTLPKKNQHILSKYLWIFSDEQIVELASSFENEYLVVKVIKALCQRNIKFVPNFEKLLKVQSPDLQEILEHFKDSVGDVSIIISNPAFYFLLDEPNADISEYVLNLESIADEVLYRIAPVAVRVAEKHKERVIYLALTMADFQQSLKIFSTFAKWFKSSEIFKLSFKFVENSPKLAMTSGFTEFLTLYIEAFNVTEDDAIRLWLQRAIIYITKKFAESVELSTNFDSFLGSIQVFLTKCKDFRKCVSLDVLNTQFEVLLRHQKWILQTRYMSYANQVLNAMKSKKVTADKLLQIFVTNENNSLRMLPNFDGELRFQSALLIYTLFNLAPSASLTLTSQLLELYLGSTRAEDLLLKDVLARIEAKTTKSWVTNVTNWDYIDELSQKDIELVGEDRLILKDKSSLIVVLNKGFVTNTVKHMQPIPSIPKGDKYHEFLEFSSLCFSGGYQDTRYDPEFLILVILNNHELVEEIDGILKFNLPKIIESGLLQFIVTCLSIDKIRDISKVILYGILKFINQSEENFKDKNIIKIYVSTILHTLQVSDHKSPIVWYFIGEFANIITNPGHFLYERVIRYVLSTPLIRPFEIPLYKTISAGLVNDDSLEEQNYYKQVTWLIELLSNGIASAEDLKILRYRETIEWALNLSNLSYVSGMLKSKILQFINEVQSFEAEGTDLLVTKFAGFSSLEMLKRSLDSTIFSYQHQALNLDQIALKTGIVASCQKRVRDWTENDVSKAVKRIHN
ncbi:CIC11C00000001444 [Sungouiella intermedia]|uniref:CIC11C00000001444 n=1 Tax=Sungouiella intermedia TaxID=45354 RepID=A0A1L0BVX5_9ASCO|nr:CIC11C00000001444 [[Candida] intermedia]